MKKIASLGTSLLMLAITQSALATEPISSSKQLDFKGLKFGTSPEEARTAFLPTMTSWLCEPNIEKSGTGSCIAEGITFAESPTRSVEFGYADGRLSVIIATLNQQAFANTVSALRSKFGAPSQSKQTTVANLTGARLPQVQHIWSIPKIGSVTATLRGQSMDTAEISYRSPERIAAEGQAKQRAKPDI